MVINLPQSLEPRRSEIEALVAQKQQAFLQCCCGYQKPAKCQAAVSRTQTIQVFDDFRFPLKGHPKGLANGQFLHGGKLLKVCLYNILPGVDSGLHCYTREQMAQRAIGQKAKAYWLSQPYMIYSADPSDLLPGLKHEIQHYFGPKMGHQNGKWDCQ